MNVENTKNYFLSLIIGTACIGLAPIFVKFCNLSPSLIGMYRTGIAGILLLAFLVATRKNLFIHQKFILTTFFAGFIFACDLFVWHRSIFLIGPGMATIFGNTQVFYLLILGFLIHKEPLTYKKIMIFIIAFMGVMLILKGQIVNYEKENFFWGVFFGLSTGFFYSLYTTSLKSANMIYPDDNSSLQVISYASISAGFWLFIFSFFESGYETSFTLNWKPILALVFICQILGWGLITHGLKKVPLAVSGLIILLQPIIAKLLGVLIFNEPTSFLEFLGAAILMTCIYFGSLTRIQVTKKTD